MNHLLKKFLRITPLLMTAALLLPNGAHAAGRVNHIAVTVSPRPAAVGQDVTITATAKDAHNATVTSYAGRPTLKDLTGSLSAPAPGPFVNGVSTTTATIGRASRGDVVFVRTADGKTGFSGLFSVIGPVDHYDARVSPKQVSLGTPQSLTVSARDSAGNLVQSYASSNTVLWAALDSGWLTFADGRAETTFTMPFAAREFAIEVLDTSNGMYAYSNTFNVIGTPDHLEGSFRRTDHRTGCASVKGNLTLKMEDNAGNVLASYNGSPDPLTLSDDAGSIQPGRPAPFMRGVSNTGVSIVNPSRPSSASITVGSSGPSVPVC